MKSVYEYRDYKAYVTDQLEENAKSQRGGRSRLAEALGCQTSYLSRVLNGNAQLSLEQADQSNAFFSHTDDEAEYFILLVEWARAGTARLRAHFERQIARHQEQHISLRKRFRRTDSISESEQQVYYSSWQYGAVLMALTIPNLQTKEAIAAHFGMPLKRVAEILEFLTSAGLACFEKGKLTKIKPWPHITGNQALASRDHANWRLKAIGSFETRKSDDIHYSSAITLSESDVYRIKRKLLETLEEIREIVRPSKEEKICSFLLDFFEI